MKNYTLSFFACCIVLYSMPLQAASFSSRATGNWNVATTWTLTSGSDADGIPDTDDNVTVGSNHAIVLVSATTITSLTMNSGSITGANTLTITGNFTMNSGIFAPDDAVTIGGTFSWSSNGTIGVLTSPSVLNVTINGVATIDGNIDRELVKRKLILNGGGTWILGSINLSEGGILEVASGQTLTYNSTGTYSLNNGSGSGNSFELKGNLILQSSGLRIFVPVNNTGVISGLGGLEIKNTLTNNGMVSKAAAIFGMIR